MIFTDNFEKPKASRKRAAAKADSANSPTDDGPVIEVKETPKKAAVSRKGRGKIQEPEQLETPVEDVPMGEVEETRKRAVASRKGRGKTQEPEQMDNPIEEGKEIIKIFNEKINEIFYLFTETIPKTKSSRKRAAAKVDLPDSLPEEVKETPKRAAPARKGRGKTQEPEQMENPVRDDPVIEIEETPKRTAPARKGRGKTQEPEQVENPVKEGEFY